MKLLREHMLAAAEILAALPRRPETLLALQSAYIDERKEEEAVLETYMHALGMLN